MSPYKLFLGAFYPKAEPPLVFSEGVLYAVKNAEVADKLGYSLTDSGEYVHILAMVEEAHHKVVDEARVPWSTGACTLVPVEHVALKPERAVRGMLPLLSEWLVWDVEGERHIVSAYNVEDAAVKRHNFTHNDVQPKWLGVQPGSDELLFLVRFYDDLRRDVTVCHVLAETLGDALAMVWARHGPRTHIISSLPVEPEASTA